MHCRRKWQPTPVFLPGESQGRGSLVGCRLCGYRVGHNWGDLAAAAANWNMKVEQWLVGRSAYVYVECVCERDRESKRDSLAWTCMKMKQHEQVSWDSVYFTNWKWVFSHGTVLTHYMLISWFPSPSSRGKCFFYCTFTINARNEVLKFWWGSHFRNVMDRTKQLSPSLSQASPEQAVFGIA